MTRSFRDKCGGSDKESYWELPVEKRRKAGVKLSFEKSLWEEVEWAMRKPSVTCDDTLDSNSMNAPTQPSLDGGRSDRGHSDGSDNSSKMRRMASGKVGGGEGPATKFSIIAAMEDLTPVYREGLDHAAEMLAKASAGGAGRMADRMGDMAIQIGEMASAMKDGHFILQMLVCVMPRRSGDGGASNKGGGGKG
ncbi:hypothetical protein CBR_g5631 [Chara braunii]|uniref:Uncharacterized protein n=1 Tax=Chara braunii TaxID=69332 RepID=A0A388JRQ5_CHABU|nr:hypothetical protein CBR_g5631 [Chara braunii]|eukprot:GBG60457.1 hypothetical protein CBR_g5631 [Chara braunii]